MTRGGPTRLQNPSTGRRRTEGGSAAIETAIVLGLLITLVIGAFEYGMAFRNWLTISSASREGARVGSAAGDLVSPIPNAGGADCMILEAVSAALQNVPSEEVAEVWIYKSDASGRVAPAFVNRYRPKQDSDAPVNLTCNAAWARFGGNNWPEASRNNDGNGADRDWLGVAVIVDDRWETGLLWFRGSVRWRDDTVMRLEPDTD
jgi:hypothetical protein